MKIIAVRLPSIVFKSWEEAISINFLIGLSGQGPRDFPVSPQQGAGTLTSARCHSGSEITFPQDGHKK